jgi:GNAT superfamily N-acetyltransferase
MLILVDLRVHVCLTATAPRSASDSWHFLSRRGQPETASRAGLKDSDGFVGGPARDRPGSSAEHPIAEQFMSAGGEREHNLSMPAASIRPATLADVEGIGLVHVRSWQSAYQGKMPQHHLDGLDPARRAEVWRRIAEETEPTRGVSPCRGGGGRRHHRFASFGPSRDSDTDPQVTGEVFAIYAHPDDWGTGTGRALMASTVVQLARLGYADAILWVLDTNNRARRFYALEGWEIDGANKADGSRGFDITEVRYRKALGHRG